MPLIREGRLVAIFSTAHPDPRRWTEAEKTLQRGVAERTWAAVERARAEVALRDSESRLRTLFDAIDEGFLEVEVVMGADGRVIDWRHVTLNPAFERLSGLRDVTGKLISEVMPAPEAEWAERFAHVVTTGEAIRFELPVAGRDRCFDVFVTRIGGGGSRRLAVIYTDVTEQRRAEAALRESEERQTFLLKLSDAIRPAADPLMIYERACALLASEMDVERACYVEVDEDAGIAVVQRDYARGHAPSLAGKYPIASFEWSVAILRRGECHVVADTRTSPLVPDTDRQASATLGIIACIGAPVFKDERLVGALCVTDTRPRDWRGPDIRLVRDVAERIWSEIQRTRAENRLRESEERFAQFAKASSAGIWVRDAGTLAMEYVSPAIGMIYGIGPDEIIGSVEKWGAMIVPDDRDVALEHIARARHGESVVHEFRIQRPSDHTFRWIRNTDFPLHAHGHVQRIGGIAEDITDEKLAVEHQGILVAELQHRVRNIMAMIRSITARSGEHAESVQAYSSLMLGRLLALARVQALLTSGTDVSVGIQSIVYDEVSAQAQHDGQYVLEGPDIALSPKAAEVLTLAVHELATNALKYGALSVPNGRVTVRWSSFQKRGMPWLAFDWREEGGPAYPPPTLAAPRRRGFGSELIEDRVPYELKGKGKVTIEPGGAQCHLEFPLTDDVSILETGAPQRATVFGGALDMTGEPDLGGHRILVVEDDYYLATDSARALQGAGAQVIGPCATEQDARAELATRRPDAAVLDINLGLGASFKLAETLKDQGIPFVFTTGYDKDMIPLEFRDVERLEKPVQLRQIIGAVFRLVGDTT